MPGGEAIETALRRDRQVVIAALILAVALSWLYLLLTTGMTTQAPARESAGRGALAALVDAARPMAWTPGHAVMMLAMWWIMMVAMMLPAAASMILMFAAINRRTASGDLAATWIFAGGYLVVWGGFSLAATALQWRLDKLALMSPTMTLSSLVLGAALLILAGIWQLTPLKQACLRHCRSPVGFITRYWRPGRRGALALGLRHGALCLGCCWLIMLLLFYGGIMNITWILGLAALALIERLAPAGHWIGRAVGLVLIAAGSAILVDVT